MSATTQQRSRFLPALLVVLASIVAAPLAQAPDLSGTWKLNRPASQIVPGAGLAGLERGGVPNSLYITQAANGSIFIGSDHNGQTARLYVLGGESTITIPSAANATIAVRARHEGRTLVVESSSTPALKEVFTLSADGQTLTVVVTSTAADGPKTTTLVYAKTMTEAPCTAWPTDCSR